MSGTQGIPFLPESLDGKTAEGSAVICLDPAGVATEAEVLQALIEAGYLLPDGTPPTGTLNTIVTPIYPTQFALDGEGNKKEISKGSCIVVDGTLVNPGTPFQAQKQPKKDEDCDGFLVGETITIENTGTGIGAFRVCSCLIALDADDNDPLVGGGGEEGEREADPEV